MIRQTALRMTYAATYALTFTLCAVPARAAEVVFEQQEVLGFDWARHLLTYEVEFKRGQANAGNLSLLDAEGASGPKKR